MPEHRRYDVDWTDENHPQIVIAQPGDRHAMTISEAQQAITEGLAEVLNVEAGLSQILNSEK